jgi:hypothetical protein
MAFHDLTLYSFECAIHMGRELLVIEVRGPFHRGPEVCAQRVDARRDRSCVCKPLPAGRASGEVVVGF